MVEAEAIDIRGPARPREPSEEIGVTTIHPPFERLYVASEHHEGSMGWLGDELGTDYIVGRFLDGWVRLHDGDGRRNEDWYGYGETVLAPIGGRVVEAQETDSPNLNPGRHGGGVPGRLAIQAPNGTYVGLGHVTDIAVEVDDQVEAGQPVAKLGNNGSSWMPHLHVGAWRGDTPLQIRVDLAALAALVERVGEAAWAGLREPS